MALPVRVLDEDERTGGDVAHLAIARPILYSAVEPHSEKTLRYGVPADLPHASCNSCKANG